ncbi:MAG: TadG family pilus assembly protein [Planctomycetota bacterium]
MLSAVLMVVMIGMLAFAIDLGCIVHARTALQRTVDACALAAAARLPDESAATAVARSVATENGWSNAMKISTGDELDGSDLDPMTIEYGRWDRDAATFTSPPSGGNEPNAVRVTLERSEAIGNPLSLFFARIFGNSTAETSASATALYDRWLCGPFVGIDWVSVPGTPNTDSYNSAEGAYSAATAKHRGSICSDGPINVDGAGLVKGDARAGEGYDVTITGGATVTRSIGSRLTSLDMPPVDASAAAVTNDNGQIPLIPQGNSFVSPVDADGNFLLDGTKAIDMPPGTYYFNNFTVTGQASFTTQGLVKIYITGNLERSGGALVTNSTGQPENLQFYMTGGTALVTSENTFQGVIYAPNTDVTIDGSADLFGAVVGKTLTATGSGFAHYDESLELDDVEFSRRVALVD